MPLTFPEDSMDDEAHWFYEQFYIWLWEQEAFYETHELCYD